MPATEYSTRPREAATSTMQMAMKIVEMRIMSRATLLQRRNLSINVDSMDQCCFGGVGRGPGVECSVDILSTAFPGCCAARRPFRRGALLIRGPSALGENRSPLARARPKGA